MLSWPLQQLVPQTLLKLGLKRKKCFAYLYMLFTAALVGARVVCEGSCSRRACNRPACDQHTALSHRELVCIPASTSYHG
jgi:hypothetical protein